LEGFVEKVGEEKVGVCNGHVWLYVCFRSALVAQLLQLSGLSYTHLSTLTPPHYKLQPSQPNWMLARGVLQRNTGLAWLRSHLDTSPETHGVLYFADDDNTYDLRLFEEVRVTVCGVIQCEA